MLTACKPLLPDDTHYVDAKQVKLFNSTLFMIRKYGF